MNTPHANAVTGSCILGAKNTALVINEILRNTGVTAGTANLPKLLSMEPANAVNDIKKIYGNVIINSCVDNSYLIGSSKKPGANNMIKSGAASIPIAVMNNRMPPNVPDVSAIKFFSDWSGEFLYSANTGMNACEKAPSANKRRRKFGILNATKNTSAPIPAPNILAMTISLKKPKIRERKVITLTTAVDLNNFSLIIIINQKWGCRSKEER